MQRTCTNRATTNRLDAHSVRERLMAQLQKAEIPPRIKQARKEAGLTQTELAALLQVQPRTYQNYELDRVPWPLINQIAEATGKTTEWLLHGDAVVERAPTPDPFAATDLERIERKIDALLTGLSIPWGEPADPGEALEQELEDAAEQDERRGDDSEEDGPGQSEEGQAP